MSCYLCHYFFSVLYLLYLWGFYFMLIYRCGPGALLLFMVLGASLREELPLSVYVCMCVVMCFTVRGTQNWCRAPSQCKSVTDSSCWICFLNTRNSSHNYDKVMLSFFCGGLKLAPITMTTSALGTANIGPDRGRHWSGDAFPPQSGPECLHDPLAPVCLMG